MAVWGRGKRNAAEARPLLQRAPVSGHVLTASPAMVGTTESTAAEPTATRDGCFGRCSAGRPSIDTVVPSRVMELIGERPSGLKGRRANATATGTGEAFSSSTTTAPPSGTPSPEATAQARWTSSPPGMRATVSTTGLSSTRRWRTPTARAGRCHVSSAPIHQSSDQPSGHGVTAPRGSTTARSAPPTVPSSTQLRWVVLCDAPGPGTTSGEAGSAWRCHHQGSSSSSGTSVIGPTLVAAPVSPIRTARPDGAGRAAPGRPRPR